MTVNGRNLVPEEVLRAVQKHLDCEGERQGDITHVIRTAYRWQEKEKGVPLYWKNVEKAYSDYEHVSGDLPECVYLYFAEVVDVAQKNTCQPKEAAMPRDARSEIRDYFAASTSAFVAMGTDTDLVDSVVQAAKLINTAFAQGRRLYVAGNGGSSADADHFAAELVGRYRKGDKPKPAMSFSNSSVMSAWSNDDSFNNVFGRMLEAYGREGDVFFAISTSGNSPNILRGLKTAKSMGVHTVGLLGQTGGDALALCEIQLRVPATYTPRVQELHIAVIHALCECLER